MTQRDRLRQLIIDFCNEHQRRTFTLQALHQTYGNYENIGIQGQTPQNTIRRLLQELRDGKFLTFDEGHGGNYTLRDEVSLDHELLDQDEGRSELSPMSSHKSEYLIEVFNRDGTLVREAKDKFGRECMYEKCRNTFSDPQGEPYIEVHHIIPLCRNGEDAIWNLSVLCGHHHKQAHFAHQQERDDLEKYLLGAVRERL